MKPGLDPAVRPAPPYQWFIHEHLLGLSGNDTVFEKVLPIIALVPLKTGDSAKVHPVYVKNMSRIYTLHFGCLGEMPVR